MNIRKIIREEIEKLFENYQLNEETFRGDIREFLAMNPRAMTNGTAYYVSSMDSSMNKFITDEFGDKIPNPMLGKLFKNTRYYFPWKDTYQKAINRATPDYEIGKRSGTFEKDPEFSVLERGKSGDNLPIIPTGTEYTFSMFENGNYVPVDKDEIKKYLKPASSSKRFDIGGGTPFRNLTVKRIYKLTGGGNVWMNPEFEGKYLGPGSSEI